MRFYGQLTKKKRQQLLDKYGNPDSGLHSKFHVQGNYTPEKRFEDLTSIEKTEYNKEQ